MHNCAIAFIYIHVVVVLTYFSRKILGNPNDDGLKVLTLSNVVTALNLNHNNTE